MDIQVASNFERLLYFILDGDSEKLCEVMAIFSETGKYSFDHFEVDGFTSSSVSQARAGGRAPAGLSKVAEIHHFIVRRLCIQTCGLAALK